MPFSAAVGPHPGQAVKRVTFGFCFWIEGSHLSKVLDSLALHIPDWINSTAAWIDGQSVGRCVAATSDDVPSMRFRGMG